MENINNRPLHDGMEFFFCRIVPPFVKTANASNVRFYQANNWSNLLFSVVVEETLDQRRICKRLVIQIKKI